MKRFFLVLGFFSSWVLFCPAFAFTDVSQDYVYHDSIQVLQNDHIVQGYPDDTYRSEAPVTRAELLKVLVESFPDKFPKTCTDSEIDFPDIGAGRWFTDYICKAAKSGLVDGYPDGFFRPHQFINVAELSKIVSRLKLQIPNNKDQITDEDQRPWFQSSVENMEAWHYLLPTFVWPSDLVNRGELAEVVHRMNEPALSEWFSGYDTTYQTFIPQSDGPLTRIPWKLNLEVLPHMRLEGRDFEIGKMTFQNSRYKTYQITYLSNGIKISGMMNIPKGGGPFPVIVLAHGYYPHELYWSGTGLKREQDYFVRSGFVTVHPDYRGYAQSDADPENRGLYDGAMGYTMDVVNLIGALRKTQGLENLGNQALLNNLELDNSVIFGHSMGGGVALNIAVMFPGLFKATVLYAPSGGSAWDNYKRWWKDRPGEDWSLLQWKTPVENLWSWNHLSSKYFLENLENPIYIFHGEEDGNTPVGVPVSWSDELSRFLREKNKIHQYFRYTKQEHVFVGDQWVEMMLESKQLFEQVLE
ncbi:MAG TPA: alpha/beta fold hydrolase [Candidatus Gracilibacteria bacterium]